MYDYQRQQQHVLGKVIAEQQTQAINQIQAAGTAAMCGVNGDRTIRDKPEVTMCLDRLMSLVSDLQGIYSAMSDRIGPVLLPCPPDTAGEGGCIRGGGSEVGHRITAACDQLEQLHHRIHADMQRVAV